MEYCIIYCEMLSVCVCVCVCACGFPDLFFYQKWWIKLNIYLYAALLTKRHKAPRSQTPSRWVFSNRLNCSRLSHSRRWVGSMFHTRGSAAATHRSPKLLFDRRTTHVAVSVDQSRRVLTQEVSWQSSARYAGACPVRQVIVCDLEKSIFEKTVEITSHVRFPIHVYTYRT